MICTLCGCRYYPTDVTQVLQYVTLYQTFLATREAVVTGELQVSIKDAMLLAALSCQALRGDVDPSNFDKAGFKAVRPSNSTF